MRRLEAAQDAKAERINAAKKQKHDNVDVYKNISSADPGVDVQTVDDNNKNESSVSDLKTISTAPRIVKRPEVIPIDVSNKVKKTDEGCSF